jgi:hypothetical protein
MFPDFLIIGAQKAGSTLLLKCLREHPDVFMPFGETRVFEDPEYVRTDVRHFFEKLFAGVSQKKAVGIKRPAYLAKPECPERIHRLIPNAKLVVVLRNPVERAISAYYHYMRCGYIPIRPSQEGLTKLIEGQYENAFPKSAEIIEYGRYHEHLRRYLKFFEKCQLQILIFDAFKANPFESMKQVYRFVGVSDSYTPVSLSMKSHRNPGVYSLTRLRVLTIRNACMYSYNEDRTNRYRIQPNPLGRFINKIVTWVDERMLTPICTDSKPELTRDLVNRLYKIYESDITQLEDLLGQKLTKWKVCSPLPSN